MIPTPCIGPNRLEGRRVSRQGGLVAIDTTRPDPNCGRDHPIELGSWPLSEVENDKPDIHAIERLRQRQRIR